MVKKASSTGPFTLNQAERFAAKVSKKAPKLFWKEFGEAKKTGAKVLAAYKRAQAAVLETSSKDWRYQLYEVGFGKLVKEGKPFSAASFLKHNEDMVFSDLPKVIGDQCTFGGGAASLMVIERVR